MWSGLWKVCYIHVQCPCRPLYESWLASSNSFCFVIIILWGSYSKSLLTKNSSAALALIRGEGRQSRKIWVKVFLSTPSNLTVFKTKIVHFLPCLRQETLLILFRYWSTYWWVCFCIIVSFNCIVEHGSHVNYDILKNTTKLNISQRLK